MKKMLVIAALVMAMAATAWARNDRLWNDEPVRRAPQPSSIVSINVKSKTDNMGNFYRTENGLVFDNYGNTFKPVDGGVIDLRDGHFIQFVR